MTERTLLLLISVALQLVSQSYVCNIWRVSIRLNISALTWLRHNLNQKFVGESFHHKLHYHHNQRPLQPFSDFIGFVLLAGFWQKHGSLNVLKRMNNSVCTFSSWQLKERASEFTHTGPKAHLSVLLASMNTLFSSVRWMYSQGKNIKKIYGEGSQDI